MHLSLWKKIALSLLVILVTSGIGLWIGSLNIPDAHNEAQKIKWTSRGSPPEPAEKITGVFLCEDQYGVIVESTAGNGYIACPSGWQPWDKPDITPMLLDTCRGNPPTSYSPAFETLPRPVRACAFRYMNEWTIVENVYTILDDGSVWEWNFTFGIGNVIAQYINGLFWGFIGGVILSSVVWLGGKRWK
jgi:hypothetical protein